MDDDHLDASLQLVVYDDTVRRILGISVETINGDQLLYSEEEEDMDCTEQVIFGEDEHDVHTWDYEEGDSQDAGVLHSQRLTVQATPLVKYPISGGGGTVSLSCLELDEDEESRLRLTSNSLAEDETTGRGLGSLGGTSRPFGNNRSVNDTHHTCDSLFSGQYSPLLYQNSSNVSSQPMFAVPSTFLH